MCIDDGCEDAKLGRREFLLGGAAFVALGGLGANAQPAPVASLPPTRLLDDPSIQHGPVVFQHDGKATIDGYIARPKAAGKYHGVMVIAGNRITEEYIPNTCAALAVAGFVGLSPNTFHPLPESARTREEMQQALAAHTELDALDDIQAGVSYLRSQPDVDRGGLGMVGFCKGGREALLFAARSREVDAVVAFHPRSVEEHEIARLTVPVQLHHGTADRTVSHESTRELEAMLRRQSTPVDVFLYENLDHGFLAYTRRSYDPEAAQLAWQRSVEFLRLNLEKKPGR